MYRTVLTAAAVAAALTFGACASGGDGGASDRRPAAQPIERTEAATVSEWHDRWGPILDVGAATLRQISSRADVGDIAGAQEACGVAVGAWSDVARAVGALPASVADAAAEARSGTALIRAGLRECVAGNFESAAADIGAGGEKFSTATALLG